MTNKVLDYYTFGSYTNRSTQCSSSPDRVDIVTSHVYNLCQSGNSPRINGRLRLRQNFLNRILHRVDQTPVVVSYSYKTSDPNNSCVGVYNLDPWPYVGPPIWFLPSSSDDQSYADASSSFYGDLNAIKVNLMVAFAERQQTIDLIAKTCLRLAGLYRSFKRGRNPFTRRDSNPNHAGDLWLEYNYGWRPLVSDVYGAMEAAKLEPPKVIHKVSRTTHLSPSKIEKDFPFWITPDIRIISKTDLKYQLKTTCRGSVTVSDPSVALAQSLGLTNPALLLWEKLPYSFVVDWFFPIGSWLEAQQALLGLSVSDPSVTRTLRGTGGCDITVTSRSSSTSASGTGRVNINILHKNRDLSLPLILPPKFKNPVSVSHALSALSLLSKAFR